MNLIDDEGILIMNNFNHHSLPVTLEKKENTDSSQELTVKEVIMKKVTDIVVNILSIRDFEYLINGHTNKNRTCKK